MIDKVKTWCRMCTIMRDCGEEEGRIVKKEKKETNMEINQEGKK